MAVSNEIILDKMLEQIDMAKNNDENIKNHIGKIKLLCELIIDSNDSCRALEKIEVENSKKDGTLSHQQKNEEDDPYSIFEF